MPKESEFARIYTWKSFAPKPIGRPSNRWEDDVRKNLQIKDQQLKDECIG
jgi:hypothetical protein